MTITPLRRRPVLLVLLVVALLTGSVGSPQPASAASGDCGFTGDVNLFDANGASSGLYTDPANWDAGAVPWTSAQACIPSGKTAMLASGENTLPASLKVQGTLRVIDGSVILARRDPVVEVTGRIEVPAGATLNMYFGGSFTLGSGGVIRVESGGSYLTQQPFVNNGAVDLSGGGAFTVYGNLGRFTQGGGSVIGGKLEVASGATLDLQGDGAGAFTWQPGSQGFLAGTIAANQSVDLACADSSSTVLQISTAVINNGTLRMNPRVAGTTCENRLSVHAGGSLTNQSQLILGSAAKPQDPVVLAGAGSLLNGPTGTVTVAGTAHNQMSAVRTDGTFTVAATGSFGQGGFGVFELRDGTLNNQGQYSVGSGITFRQLLGVHTGNRISILTSARLELLGPGAGAYLVPSSVTATLQNPSGPVLIRPNQSITLDDSSLAVVGPVENQGQLLLTGRGDGQATFGSGGDVLTNRGRIDFTSKPDTGVGGIGVIAQSVVNETDGVMASLPGRDCQLAFGTFENKGLVDLAQSCRASATVTLDATSVLRVRSSAAALTTMYDLRNTSTLTSTLGGTLDVVTDPANPPAEGPPRGVVTPRAPIYPIAGTFSALQGSVSGSLGYALSYPTDGGRRAALQVVPASASVTVSAVSAPPSGGIGADVTVAWATAVSGATSATFTDTVLLSDSPVPNASAVLLGRFQHSGSTMADVARPASLLVRLPAGHVGRRYVVVVADSAFALSSSDRSGSVASAPIDVEATDRPADGSTAPITVGADTTRMTGPHTAALEGTRLLRLTGDQGDVVVTLSPSAAVIALSANGRVPTDADHDVRASDGTLVVPRLPGGGPRYVLLHNTGPADVTVNVTASAPGASIAAVTPTLVIAGSPADTPVLVRGTGFTPASAAKLQCGSQTVDATKTFVESTTSLTSVFALPSALGTCDVVVGSATRADALSVIAPPSPPAPGSLEPRIDITGPALARTGVDNRITVRWTNDTAYALPAPLFQVSVDFGTVRFPGTPGNGLKRVDLLGVSPTGPAGLLAPGATGSAELLVRGLVAHEDVTYSAAGIRAANAFDFGGALNAFLADDLPAAAKAWVAAQGPLLLGVPRLTTVGAFQEHLGDVATALSTLGRRVPEVARLMGHDLERITDSGRLEAFYSGEYGAGQTGLVLPRLTVQASSSDVVITAGLERLRFSRQSNGSYLSPPLSADVLSSNAGGWVLVARDGTRRAFNTAGRLTSVTDEDQRLTTFAYTGALLTTVTHPGGATTDIGYDSSGRMVSFSDPVDVLTTYSYDTGGRLAAVATLGQTTTATWNADDLPVSFGYPGGQTVGLSRDQFGRVTETRVGGTVRATYTYGADGGVTATDALGRTATTWLDDTGQVARVVDAGGRITTLRRDARGNAIGLLADGVPIGESLRSDAAGKVSGTVDAAGQATAVRFDVDGLLSSVTDPLGHRTAVTRDANLRPTAVTDPAGAKGTLSYDSQGRPVTLTDRSGRAATFSYAPDGELSQHVVPGFGTTTYTRDARKNVTSAAGPTGTTAFTWDANNRLTSVSYPTGLGLTFGYDSAGRRTSTTTSDGRVTTVGYDGRGRLASVATAAGLLTRYEYDELDNLTAVANQNGSRTELTRNVLGHVTRQRTTCCTPSGTAPGSSVIADVQLTHDQQDRVVSRTDTSGTTTYTYDAAGRLSGADASSSGGRTLSYSYDAAGNRTQEVDSVEGSTASTMNAAGRPTSHGAAAVTHDAAGRVTSKGADTYAWDARGTLSAVSAGGTTTTYTYDALGTPLTRTTGGVTTTLLIDPTGFGSLVGEYAGDGTFQAGYAWGQGLAARTDSSGAPSSFYAADTRGDVVALTDAAGSVTDTYRYLPFGEVVARTGSTQQPFGFEGMWGMRTEPTGLVNARARVYDPQTGRFLTEDPEPFAAANPSTWVSSDPMNRFDPDGRAEGFFAQWSSNWLHPLGFSNQPGSAGANLVNGVGLASTLLGAVADGISAVEGSLALSNLTASGRDFDLAADLLKASDYPGGGAPLQNALKHKAELRQAATAAEQRGLKHASKYKAASKAGTGLGVLGGLINLYQGYEAYKKEPGFWNGVRQGNKAFLKTIAPPLLAIGFDTLEGVIDDGSLWVLQRLNKVDPITAGGPGTPNSHWNAKNHLPQPKGGSPARDSGDPNAIVGPEGVTVGSSRYVARPDSLPYTVFFQNVPTASLAANEVVVTHTLDSDVDLSTFELGTVGVAGRQWQAPPGSRAWSTLLDDQPQSGLMIRLKARLDLTSRQVTWTLTGIDPDTGDVPTDATRGFLPPDVTAPQGQGFLSYTARAGSSVATGTTIVAQASIIFDANAPIATNVDTVVVDADAPTATPSVPAMSGTPVTVTLGGVDGASGSGLGGSEIWVSQDGGDFELVAVDVSTPTYSYTGLVGSAYRFRVRPSDRAGNVGELSAPTAVVVIQAPAPGGYAPLVPARLLDTRLSGPCVSGAAGRLLTVTGVGGVPAGASAVALNVTAVGASVPGYVSVFPAGSVRPVASSVNFGRGQVVANGVLAKVGSNGQLQLFASAGCPQLVVDVVGWFAGGAPPAAGGFSPLVPARLLDTRLSGPCVSGAAGRLLTVTGVGGVPAGASAVALNVTAVGASVPGYVSVFPAGSVRPVASSVNFGRGAGGANPAVANGVLAKVGSNGQLQLFASAGCPQLVVDVVGWFAGGAPPAAGGFSPLVPARLLDTRLSGPCVSGAAGRLLTVTGVGGVPAGASAVALNVTAVGASVPGYVSVFPAGSVRPVASSVNFGRGQVVANGVLAKVGSNGQLQLFASAGCPQLVVDVVGWFADTG